MAQRTHARIARRLGHGARCVSATAEQPTRDRRAVAARYYVGGDRRAAVGIVDAVIQESLWATWRWGAPALVGVGPARASLNSVAAQLAAGAPSSAAPSAIELITRRDRCWTADGLCRPLAALRAELAPEAGIERSAPFAGVGGPELAVPSTPSSFHSALNRAKAAESTAGSAPRSCAYAMRAR